MTDARWRVLEGDCFAVMAAMEAESVHAIVTDPPYGIGFMGKEWDGGKSFVERRAATQNRFDHVGGNHNPVSSADAARTRHREGVKYGAWCEAWAAEALRVLKPGGHMLAFGGTRTHHRLMAGVEDAGFEIRDVLMWLYGSGFPKSHNIAKAIDREAGVAATVIGKMANPVSGEPIALGGGWQDAPDLTIPTTPAAQQWDGWGTALKPAYEPILLARKALDGTTAATVLAHGAGALNIDDCRIPTTDPLGGGAQTGVAIDGKHEGWRRPWMEDPDAVDAHTARIRDNVKRAEALGRWPANVVLDEEAGSMLDAQSGTSDSSKGKPRSGAKGNGWGMIATGSEHSDSGGASRFFYTAKASGSERGEFNTHPTVKPIDLMRWLVRLITPPDGTVLDPFAGSGSTLLAALAEGRQCVGIEREPEYVAILRRRLGAAQIGFAF